MNPSPNTSIQPPKELVEKMTSLRLHGVPAPDIPGLWPYVLPVMEVAEGFWRGRMDAKHVLHECMMGRMQLWVIADSIDYVEAAIVTQVCEYPTRRACRYVLVSGRGLKAWEDADEVLTAWAVQRGCSLIEATGRPGWKSKMKARGWVSPTVVYEKEI